MNHDTVDAQPATPPVLRLRSVRPGQGAVWVRHAFRVFFQRPLAFCLLVVTCLAVSELLLFLPLGGLVTLALVPLASLGFMIGTRQTLEGRFPWPTVFLEPLRQGRTRWIAHLQLGLIYAVAAWLIWILYRHIGGTAMVALQKAMAEPNMSPERLQPFLMDPSLLMANAVMATLSSLLSVPFWHAPALVHWAHQNTAKALFSSTLAWWRNKGAMTVYGLTWAGTMLLFLFVAQIVIALLGRPQMVLYAAMPAQLLFATLILVSLYFSFADSFERVAPAPAEITP